METKKEIILISVLIVLLISSLTLFTLESKTLNSQNKDFNASVQIVNSSGENTTLGINSDRSLDFGEVPQGSNVTKFVNVTAPRKSLMKISSEGNISELLQYKSRRYFEGNKKIDLEARGTQPGYHEGIVKLNFQIPNSKLGQKWLEVKWRILKEI